MASSTQPELPDPLIAGSGTRVTTAQQWRERRRGEILALFQEHVYGKPPATPATLDFEVLDEAACALGGGAVRRQVAIHVGASGRRLRIDLLLYLPAGSGPFPVFTLLNFGGNHTVHIDPAIAVPEIHPGSGSPQPRGQRADNYPIDRILERGYGIATAYCGDVYPDFYDGSIKGAHALFEESDPSAGNAWGAVGAWAWGLSRMMDYLVDDSRIDGSRICLAGHSRLGKAALWAGAQDERFALVISNNSGCTGAALSRGKRGETVRAINDRFPHWFCANYKSYNDREDRLPVDQHMLLALIAPRPLYVTSASEDSWADPVAEFRSCRLAEPVYHLFGLQGLETVQPPPEHPLLDGRIGYHLRTGPHGLHCYDWERFLDFADRRVRQKS